VARHAEGREWEGLRDLRLRALADTPEAFGTTLAEASLRTDEEWKERYASRAEQATFVEEDEDGRLVGMASGFRESSEEVVYLVGMFVSPESRGHGLGRRLLEAVERWARDVGATRVELEVNPAVGAAARLYERRGYRPTGKTRPLPSFPDVTAVELAKELAG
jgi:GNAT superfamily N-acetyltransferase